MKNRGRNFSKPNSMAGFSLLEVLISIVVLCIGLLGMVGLQASSLQANREARLQSAGVALARELGETIRSNPAAAALATGNPYLVATTSPLAATTPSYCLSVGSSCADTNAIANAQLTEWLARVDAELPGARVAVCFDASPYDSAGQPEWACDPTNAGATLVIKIGWTRAAFSRGATAAGATAPPPDRATHPSVVLPLAVLSGS
jgi:type IV pilus assembly protein PilV